MKTKNHNSASNRVHKGINRLPGFPIVRLRRLRRTAAIRTLFQETHLSVTDLICPIFVEEGISKPQPIESMPEIQRMPLSSLVSTAEEIRRTGIKGCSTAIC